MSDVKIIETKEEPKVKTTVIHEVTKVVEVIPEPPKKDTVVIIRK